MTDIQAKHEANRVLNFLAGTPGGNSTVNKKTLHHVLLSNGGTLLARGELHDIESKHLGAGVYRVTLKKRVFAS